MTEHAPLSPAEIACADRWDRCVAAAVHIDVHGDTDPHRIAWAADILRSERRQVDTEHRQRVSEWRNQRAEQLKEPTCNA